MSAIYNLVESSEYGLWSRDWCTVAGATMGSLTWLALKVVHTTRPCSERFSPGTINAIILCHKAFATPSSTDISLVCRVEDLVKNRRWDWSNF